MLSKKMHIITFNICTYKLGVQLALGQAEFAHAQTVD